MDITKSVAKMRFKYHANMLDVYNVLNQLGYDLSMFTKKKPLLRLFLFYLERSALV